MAEKSYSDQLKDLQVAGHVTSSATENNSILIIESGSNKINPLSVAMVKTKYDINEISKAVDTTITELLPFTPLEAPDVVPRPLYNDRLADIDRLQEEAVVLQNNIDDKITIINILLQDSASLVSENISLRQETKFFKEQYTKSIEDINKLAVDLGNSISDATERKIELLGCQALSIGLEAERNALKTQVESLTAQLEGINSITTAGGEISGQLSVGVIPDEDFIGKSTYNPQGWPFKEFPKNGDVAQIDSDPKNYTIKNASTDDVTITIKSIGETPQIVELALQGDSGLTKVLKSGQELILVVDVSISGTSGLKGRSNNKAKDYFCEIIVSVVSANKQLTEDLNIVCKVVRQAR